MPVKLIGRKATFKGKTLWEIVGNLKNLGVGRLVVKSHFANYPEPSYYKLVKIQPTTALKDKYEDRRVFAWAEHVFRGKKYPELVELYSNTNTAMFQLIPKTEEGIYLNAVVKERITEVPKYLEWPPLMKTLLEKELKVENLSPLTTVVVLSPDTVTVIKDTEEPMKLAAPPKLYTSQSSVSELTKQLEDLKAAAAEQQATAN